MSTDVSLSDTGVVFRRNFTSDPRAVASVIAAVIEHLQDHRLPPGDIANIEIVLGEVINNINEHAYRGASDRPIELHAHPESGAIGFLLVDCGVEMPGGAIPGKVEPDLACDVAQIPESGFGWCLIRQVAHGLKYVRKNGENHLSFHVTIGAANQPD